VSAEITQSVDANITQIPGSGGIFDVKVDGKLVFSKHKTGRFPNPGEMTQLLSA